MLTLLLAGEASGEGSGQVGEALEAALEDLRTDLAFVEELLLAKPVTPVHCPPP